MYPNKEWKIRNNLKERIHEAFPNYLKDKRFQENYKYHTNGCLGKFSLMTSLHGFKYVGETDRPAYEKVFWIAVLTVVFILCGYQTCALIRYWSRGSLVMTKRSSSVRVWDIPFPAITICSDNQLDSLEFQEAINNLSIEDYWDLADYAEILCDLNITNIENTTNNYISDPALTYAFTKLALSCNEMIISLTWIRDVVAPPCEYFQPIILSTGICYSLNMVPLQQLLTHEYTNLLMKFSVDKYFYKEVHKAITWSLDEGFIKSSPLIPPWSVSGDGIYNSVTLTINLHYNFTSTCMGSGSGLTVIIHSPENYPTATSSIYIQPDSLNFITISASANCESDTLKNWNYEERGCYYQHEKYLRYFKIYSQSNCELECRTNRTLKYCGCATYYQPRSEDAMVCGKASRKCVIAAGSTEFSIFGNLSAAESNSYNDCNCLPACSALNYDFDRSVVNKKYGQYHRMDTGEELSVAVIHINFEEIFVQTWFRTPIIRFNELVGNIGGVMSLFIGCSIISLFELFYFLIFHRWYPKRKNNEVKPIIPFVR